MTFWWHQLHIWWIVGPFNIKAWLCMGLKCSGQKLVLMRLIISIQKLFDFLLYIGSFFSTCFDLPLRWDRDTFYMFLIWSINTMIYHCTNKFKAQLIDVYLEEKVVLFKFLNNKFEWAFLFISTILKVMRSVEAINF